MLYFFKHNFILKIDLKMECDYSHSWFLYDLGVNNGKK